MKKIVKDLKIISFIISFFLFMVPVVWSQASHENVDDVQLYLKKINEQGPAVELYFNLGNAYLKIDSIASAIYYYEHAILIDPTNENIINNLNIARNRIIDPLVEIPDFFLFSFWEKIRNILNPNTWAFISILLMGGIFLLFYWYYYKDLNLTRRYIVLSMLLLITSVFITLALSYDGKRKMIIEKKAIVFKEKYLKSGPDQRSQDLKQLYPGYKLLILDEIEGWMKVRTIDREEGWVLPDWIKLIDIEK